MRALIFGLLLAAVVACKPSGSTEKAEAHRASTGLRYLSMGDDRGFARATEPRNFVFPADHGAHPEFRTEWWYFTGNLESADRRHFGFELTFFRLALEAQVDETRTSAWGAEQIWMAHFALTDTANGRFVASERVAREALALAGATSEPLRVWVKGWSASGSSDAQQSSWLLDAHAETHGVALSLATADLPIAHGDRGLDRKGAETGNASYYYSMPTLSARGVVFVEGEELAVTGTAWLDREWGTSALSLGVVGWDWFALQLADGGALMFYRLRLADGRASEFSSGTLIKGAGARVPLAVGDVHVTPTRYWTSDVSAARYPVAWTLQVPAEGITLEIEPYLLEQEVDLSVRYWEGAVFASGVGPDGHLTARGYLELTGY